MNSTWIANFIFSILRLSTPIIYAALSASICNKAGLMNMAIESMMLSAALGGVIISGLTQSAIIGFLAAILIGMLVGLVISFSSFSGKSDLYLTNIAMNLIASGGTVFVLYLFTGEKSNSAAAIKSLSLPAVNIPIIEKIPFIGTIVSGHNILTYGAFLAAILVNFFIYRTRLGLRIRSVGENADAAESVGISPIKMQYIAYIISGALAGIGGAFMSMGYLTAFTRDMVAGRGYIGLSANNIAGGSPIGSLFSSFLFGTADATANALQLTNVPTDFVMMLPYAVTIIGLVIISVINKKRHEKVIKSAVKEEKDILAS